jgi:hypothetical protein
MWAPVEARRLKELERENACLEKIITEQALDIRRPKGGESEKLLSPTRRRKAVGHVKRNSNSASALSCGAVGRPRDPPSATRAVKQIGVGQCGGRTYEEVRIGNRTLIAAGTENGVRSPGD